MILRLSVVLLCVAGWLRHVVGAPFDPHGVNSDLVLQYQHLQHWLFERLAAGTLPTWNPYQLAGMPAIATLQGGLYYPGNLFALVLPTPTALGAEILVHLVVAAAGLLALATRLGLAPVATITVAGVFLLRGEFLASHGFITAFEAAAWLPLQLAGVLDLAGDRRRRGVLLCAVTTGLSLLAGNTQSTVYLLYASTGFLVARLAGTRTGPRTWATSIASFAVAQALGAVVAAAQLLPTVELVAQGTRTTRALSTAAMFPYGVGAWRLQHIFVGLPIGQELSAFGIVPLLLAVTALASRRRWLVGWAVVVLVGSIGLSLGTRTPIFDVVRWLPALSWFRPKALALPMAHAAVAVLAGIAIEMLLGRGTIGRRVLVTAVLAAGLGEILATPVPPSAYTFDARADADAARYAPTFVEAAALAGTGRVWLPGGSLSPVFTTKLASRHRLRAIDDYEPLNLRRQAEYVQFLVDEKVEAPVWPGFVPSKRTTRGTPMSNRRRLIDALGLTIALVPPGDFGGARAGFLRPAGFRHVRTSSQGIELWQNPLALPRAFTVYRTLPAPPPQTLLPLLASPTFDPLAVSYVDDAAPPDAAPDAPVRGAPATIVVDAEREVVVDAMLEAPGLVVLADTAYPGWRATVDDRPAPIVVTNYLFRGVPVPAGAHRVRFVYAPWTVPGGLAASAVGMAALLAIAGWRRG